jgi:hypothetical protein
MKKLPFEILVFAALTSPAVGDILNTQFARVTKVNDYSVMVFEERNPARLWGIVVTEPRTLRQLVVGRELACEFVESYGPTIDGAKCRSGDFRELTGPESEDLSEFLLKTGAAFEFCAESRNYYGTCDGLVISHSHTGKGDAE